MSSVIGIAAQGDPIGQIHVHELDPQARAVLQTRHEELRQRGERDRLLEELTGAWIRNRRDRLASEMGSDFVARSRGLQQVTDQDQQEYAAMVEEVKNKILKVVVPGIHAAPSTPQQGDPRVATLNAYYRDTVWVGPGTVLDDDFNLQGVPAWRHELGVAGSGDDDSQVETIDVNWLMKFTAPESRFYHFFPTTAEFGSIWAFSNNNGGNSGGNENAHVHIRTSVKASVSPGGLPGSSISAGRFNVDKDDANELDVRGRPGGYPDDQLHVTEFLLQDQTVTVMFTHEFYLYARGFGAGAAVIFDGDSQGLGPVWCYVF